MMRVILSTVVALILTSGATSADAQVKCSTMAAPVMPKAAADNKIEGQVKARARIKDGAVIDVVIVSGPQIFHEAVREAMLQYKCDSDSIEAHATQVFNFRIVGAVSAAPVAIAPPPPPIKPAPRHNDIGVACPTQVPPEMPRKAQLEGIEGVVRAQIRVRDGVVQDVMMTGPRVFYAAVRAAVMQYKCTSDPGGDVVATQEFNFKLTRPPTIVDVLIGIFK